MERPKLEELARGIFWSGGARPRDMSREALEKAFRKAKERGLDIVGVAAFRGRVSTGEDAEERALFPTEGFPVDDEARERNVLREQVEIAHRNGLLVRTYLNAHQLEGLLGGMNGAAEFELATNLPGKGTKFMLSQSFAHMIVIAFIIIGNVAYFKSGRKKRL